jgi:cysteine desulfurase/selenocysteine lyase
MSDALQSPGTEGHNALKAFDVAAARTDFPILSREVYGRPLVYLDSGASAQKPHVVIDTMSEMLENEYANVHRGVHYLSQRATERYEGVRDIVARFINAERPDEIIYTRGGTEALNLIANSWGRANLQAGDEVVISTMEHHANIVPWQMLRDSIGIVLKIAPIGDDGGFLFDEFEKLLTPKTKIVSLTHVSNVLGSVVPIKRAAAAAHAVGAIMVVDGCQGITHMPVDVQDLDADFYVFSGHKLYGPNGIGIMYGKASLLADMPPWQGGGDMIASVSFEKTVYAKPPHRFEAGTPDIVETVGLGAAIEYVEGLGMDAIAAHETAMAQYAHARLQEIPGLRIYGETPDKAAIVSFTLEDVHPHDIGTIVDRAGVAVRVGHHCAEPLMHRFGLSAMARASFGLYNNEADVDTLVEALQQVQELFG